MSLLRRKKIKCSCCGTESDTPMDIECVCGEQIPKEKIYLSNDGKAITYFCPKCGENNWDISLSKRVNPE